MADILGRLGERARSVLRHDGGVKPAYRVADVRAAEAELLAQVPAGSLMQRAAAGLAHHCGHELRTHRGGVGGSAGVLLIGSGDNGGDALLAGAILAKQGVDVTAILLADLCHGEGERALIAAGGHVEPVDVARHVVAIAQADLVIDGIVGIGCAGALRGSAAALAAAASVSAARVVAADLPSGIDPDTGAVADPSAVVTADVTVTFGAIKSGLVAMPGSTHVGHLRLVDIGLGPALAALPDLEPDLEIVDRYDVARTLAMPGPTDDKYTRGVVGVVAGSSMYPGAAVLCSGAARLGGTGMVRYAGGAVDHVVAAWPDVVATTAGPDQAGPDQAGPDQAGPDQAGPDQAGTAQCWVIGPGGGTDAQSRDRFMQALGLPVVVVVDADALTVLAADAAMRRLIWQRRGDGHPTLLTPHAGEFARLGFATGTGQTQDRISAVRSAAAQLGAVVLLKGSSTLIATPDGQVVANNHSSPALATAGSGDVLAGLVGSMLASAVAHRRCGVASQALTSAALDDGAVAHIAGAAAWLHGEAGELAASGRRPVTATDVLIAISDAVAHVRTIKL